MDWGNCVQQVKDATGKVIGEAPTLDCIGPLFKNIIDFLLIFGGTAAAFFVIWSGFRLIMSGGDPKQVDEARKGLAMSILGLIIILSSFVIINLVATISRVECIKEFGFTNCLQQTPRSSIDLSKPTCTGFCVNEDSCPSGSHEVFGATCSKSNQICCK